MILTSVALENIGSFYGRHEIELKPTDEHRPIVLIGALNGSGKTTILESLQLGLYGRRARSLFRIKTGYDDYLKKLFNRKATIAEPARIELAFINEEAGASVHYRIVRSWSFRKKQPVETVAVYVDGQLDPAMSDTWDEEVERLIPRNLSHLFFFDGERIESLADPNQSAEILRTGIYSLLGVELVDQLHGDLGVYRRRLKKRTVSPVDLESLSTLEADIDNAEKARTDICQRNGALMTDLDSEERRLREASDAFEKHGGKIYESHSALEREKIEVQSTISEIDESLRNLCAHSLPLGVVEDQLRMLMEAAQAERRSTEARQLLSHLTGRDEALLQWLRDLPASTTEVYDGLDGYLAQSRESIARDAAADTTIDMPEAALAQLSTLLDSSIAAERQKAATLVEKRTNLSVRLDAIERSLAKMPDESLIRAYIEDKAHAEARCAMRRKEIERQEDEARQLRYSLEQLEKERDKLLFEQSQSKLESDEGERLANYSARVQHVLDQLKQRTLVSHLATLESHISDAFRKLLRKDSLVREVRIDPHTFGISLISMDGHEVAPQLISAGERQILAIALLWGLGQAAGRKIPIVIDTPLGRLDSVHRKQLVDEYFPEASHQVILLSTDEEIDEELSADLADSIAHKYMLHYDDETEHTSVKPGYFWN